MISLDNGHVSIEIDRRTGAITSLRSRRREIELIAEPRLAETFRLLIRENGIPATAIGRDFSVVDERAFNPTRIRLRWGRVSVADRIMPVAVWLDISLVGQEVRFRTTVRNDSAAIIEEVASPMLGGVGCPPNERRRWAVHSAGILGRGEEWLIFDEFPGTYYGPPRPTWQRAYPRDIAMPWIDIYDRGGNRGVYLACRDESPAWSAAFGQLTPGATHGDIAPGSLRAHHGPQRWPRPGVLGDEPVGLALAWATFPFIGAGVEWQGPEIAVGFHDGGWRAAADVHRTWFVERWPFRRQRGWLSEADAWQSTIISYPDGTINFRFSDLPRMAKAALDTGIRVMQIDGWHEGGIDAGYPYYRPDPRLGGADELRAAIATCQAIGVHVLLFANLGVANVEVPGFDRLAPFAGLDRRGLVRPTVGWGFESLLAIHGQDRYQMAHMDLGHDEFRELLLDELGRIAAAGAHGAQLDKVFMGTFVDLATRAPGPPASVANQGILTTLQALSDRATPLVPEFGLASETHWDRTMPLIDAVYARHFDPEHIGTSAYTFPEVRETSCITGPADLGLVNNAIRHRHVINAETLCLNGVVTDHPVLADYITAAIALRERLRHVLWDSRVADPSAVRIDHDGRVLSGVQHALQGRDAAVVLNHFDDATQRCSVDLMDAVSPEVQVHRPGEGSRAERLPLTVDIEPDELVVVTYHREMTGTPGHPTPAHE